MIVVENMKKTDSPQNMSYVDKALRVLLEYHSPRQAASLAFRIFGLRRNYLYRKALEIQSDSNEYNVDS